MSDFELITKKYARSTFVTGPELSSVKTELSGVKEDLNDKQDKLITFSEDWVNDTDIAANRITMRAGSDTVGIIIADNQINIDTESIKIEQKEHNGWKNVLKSRIEYFGPSSVQLGDSDTITIIDGKSVFVNGPLMTADGSLFVSGPVIKEITSSDNSVSIYVNGPSVDLKVSSGGGGLDIDKINDLLDNYATYDYLHSFSNGVAEIYYDANISRTLPSLAIPMPMLQALELKLNQKWPYFGQYIILEAMLPLFKVTNDNVYIGTTGDSITPKVGNTYEKLFLRTSTALYSGEHTNVPFVFQESSPEYIAVGPVGTSYAWTSWMDLSKNSNWCEFKKETIDGKEVYKCVKLFGPDGVTIFTPFGNSVVEKSSNENGRHVQIDARNYRSNPLQISIRYLFAPNIPTVSKRFVTRREVADTFGIANPEQPDELATKEYVIKAAAKFYSDNYSWDMDYAPYQPDLPEE